MQYLKWTFLFLIFPGALDLSAQDPQDLLGEWESIDSNGHGKYSVFEHDGKIYAYMYYWKDDKEEFYLEKELEKEMEKYTEEELKAMADFSNTDILKEMKELIILKDFVKKGKVWKGKMIYDEEGGTVNGTLKLLKEDELEVAYSYWGYSDKSVWKRIKVNKE